MRPGGLEYPLEDCQLPSRPHSLVDEGLVLLCWIRTFHVCPLQAKSLCENRKQQLLQDLAHGVAQEGYHEHFQCFITIDACMNAFRSPALHSQGHTYSPCRAIFTLYFHFWTS